MSEQSQFKFERSRSSDLDLPSASRSPLRRMSRTELPPTEPARSSGPDLGPSSDRLNPTTSAGSSQLSLLSGLGSRFARTQGKLSLAGAGTALKASASVSSALVNLAARGTEARGSNTPQRCSSSDAGLPSELSPPSSTSPRRPRPPRGTRPWDSPVPDASTTNGAAGSETLPAQVMQLQQSTPAPEPLPALMHGARQTRHQSCPNYNLPAHLLLQPPAAESIVAPLTTIGSPLSSSGTRGGTASKAPRTLGSMVFGVNLPPTASQSSSQPGTPVGGSQRERELSGSTNAARGLSSHSGSLTNVAPGGGSPAAGGSSSGGAGAAAATASAGGGSLLNALRNSGQAGPGFLCGGTRPNFFLLQRPRTSAAGLGAAGDTGNPAGGTSGTYQQEFLSAASSSSSSSYLTASAGGSVSFGGSGSQQQQQQQRQSYGDSGGLSSNESSDKTQSLLTRLRPMPPAGPPPGTGEASPLSSGSPTGLRRMLGPAGKLRVAAKAVLATVQPSGHASDGGGHEVAGTGLMQLLRGPEGVKTGRADASHRVHTHGVSLKFLFKLGEVLPLASMSTTEFVWDHVTPATASARCRLTDLIPPACVGSARLYVIHAWDSPLGEVVESLRRYSLEQGLDPSSTYCWLSCLSCNHHSPVVWSKDLGYMRELMRECRHVLLVLGSTLSVFSRLWPVYELWLCAQCMTPFDDNQSSDKLQTLCYAANWNQARDFFRTLDVQRAESASREERQALLADMRAGLSAGESDSSAEGLAAEMWMEEATATIRKAVTHGSRASMLLAEKHKASNPKRYAVAARKHALVLLMADDNWESEKIMRQVLQMSSERPLFSRREEVELRHELSCIMKLQGFHEEAQRIAEEVLQYFEDGLAACGASGPLPGPPPPRHSSSSMPLMGLAATAGLATAPPGGAGLSSSGPILATAGSVSAGGGSSCSGVMYGSEERRGHVAALCNLGEIQLRRGLLDAAEATFSHVLDKTQMMQGAAVRESIIALRGLASIAMHNEALERAEQCLRSALALAEDPGSGGRPTAGASLMTAEVQHQLAQVLTELSRDLAGTTGIPYQAPGAAPGGAGAAQQLLEEARELLEAARKTRLQMYPASHPLCLEVDAGTGSVLLHMGRWEDGEEMLERVLHDVEEVHGSEHAVAAECRRHLGDLREQLVVQAQEMKGDITQAPRAEGLLRRALHINSLLWSQHPVKQEALIKVELAEVLKKMGRRGEATKLWHHDKM